MVTPQRWGSVEKRPAQARQVEKACSSGLLSAELLGAMELQGAWTPLGIVLPVAAS